MGLVKICFIKCYTKTAWEMHKYDSSIRTVVEDSLIIIIRNGEIWKHWRTIYIST